MRETHLELLLALRARFFGVFAKVFYVGASDGVVAAYDVVVLLFRGGGFLFLCLRIVLVVDRGGGSVLAVLRG